MEKFFNSIADRIEQYKTDFERQGLSEGEVNEKTLEKFNTIAKNYYAKLMEMLSESDYQEYKKCVESKDMAGVQAVMEKYQKQISIIQKEFLKNLD